MKKSRRQIPITVGELERRELLSLTGSWLGQDGHDLVGKSATPGPDGVQDIHLQVAGLKPGHTVASAEVLPWGGGEWQYDVPGSSSWAAVWVQATGSTTADVFVDPYQADSGRNYYITLTYDDGTTDGLTISGGPVDPNLRMPSDSLTLGWYGQDGHDLTGTGPDVGPDGYQDAHISLGNLTPVAVITSATLTASSGKTWQFGAFPTLQSNAELVRSVSDGSSGDFYFSPDTNLAGQLLTLSVTYANGTSDQDSVLAGPTSPGLLMAAPAPVSVTWGALNASWIGQDGINLTGPGDVHIAVAGIPAGRSVASAVLSDQSGTEWAYNSPNNPGDLPLAVKASSTDPTRADLAFPPVRDESDATLTLRLVLDNGTMLAVRLPGGPADTGLRAPGIAATSIVASPSDNLSALANQYGTVHLSAGIYNLSRPLVLNKPVTITADPGAVLMFNQGPDVPQWTAAIKINAGHTTLNGFSVRFAGPINWNWNTSYGPAVIGSPDNFDPTPSQPLVDITISGLGLESPPVAATTMPGDAPHLIRMVSALNGVITDNTLKGGMSEFFGGPWQVIGNVYQGTVPNTTAASVFSFHYSHDLVVSGNTAQPVGPSGKTWRFLVMTQSGTGDLIENNNVSGIGPFDSDTIPDPNANEVILTEAYRLHFEGDPSSISSDGLIVQVPALQGDPVTSGDVVSILSGPDAGQYRRIAQVINPTAFLLDTSLPTGSYAISISTGFVGETFQGNTVDTRGSSTADDLVLAGNHFGTQVIGNTFLGGNHGIRLQASPTEVPDIWGWSHAPFLGVVVKGNTIEDAQGGAQIDVDHSAVVRQSVGRTSMSITLTDNTFDWSDSFLAARAQAGKTTAPLALTIGQAGSADPGELLLTASGNEIEGGAAALSGPNMQVVSATVNGQALTGQALTLPALPAAPTNLRLVNDSGLSATDKLTNDGHLQFDPVTNAVGYEYSVTGAAGSYLPVVSPSSFLPARLAQGTDSVFVRGFDASGRRGPASSITFTYDSTPPPAITGLTVDASGHVQFQPVTPGDVYVYSVGNSSVIIPLGAATSFTDPSILLAPGTVRVHPIDPAGNVGPDAGATAPIVAGQTLIPPPPASRPAGSPPATSSSPTASSGDLLGFAWSSGVLTTPRPAVTHSAIIPKGPRAAKPAPKRAMIRLLAKEKIAERVQARLAAAHARAARLQQSRHGKA